MARKLRKLDCSYLGLYSLLEPTLSSKSLPFLSCFFEEPASSVSATLGTQTLTETSGEGTDNDDDYTARSTENTSCTSIGQMACLGTQTGTKVGGETYDSDPASGLWARNLL